MTFSERYGFVAPREALQKNNLHMPTRNRLVNEFIGQYLSDGEANLLTLDGLAMFKYVVTDFFKRPVATATDRYDRACNILVDWSSACRWCEIMDFFEFVAEMDNGRRRDFTKQCNQIFEDEKVAYRFVQNKITSIVDEIEISEMEQALALKGPFTGVREHLNRALELYSDRANPDYRNTIKEAISAVESAAKIISRKKRATLVDAIKTIEAKHHIHPALRDALIKLYGYSSDKGGIRHGLMDDPSVGHAEAKLMLVECSAFCNYMIEQFGEDNST
jgi:hypothetical protein